MQIPKLQFSGRRKEYDMYQEHVIDKIVYFYLFKGKSHRKLDEECIKIDSKHSKGWQSMNILHYMGMKNEFKGIFSDVYIETAIERLKILNDSNYNHIIESLERYRNINNLDILERDNKKISNSLRHVSIETIANYVENTNNLDDSNSLFDLSRKKEIINERTKRHNNIVKKFAKMLVEKHFDIFEGRIDCLGVRKNEIAVIGEIKTLDGSKKDEYSQVMKAFSQLYYYEEFNMGEYNNIESRKVAVFENKISDEHINFLEKNNIFVIWIDKKEFLGVNKSKIFLDNL